MFIRKQYIYNYCIVYIYIYVHYMRGVLGLRFKVSIVYVSQIRYNINKWPQKKTDKACRELILASHSFTRYEHLHRRGFVRLINIRKALLTLSLWD